MVNKLSEVFPNYALRLRASRPTARMRRMANRLQKQFARNRLYAAKFMNRYGWTPKWADYYVDSVNLDIALDEWLRQTAPER